jgi:Zn-dependent peptidase ImmA (M78 family)
VDIDVYPAVASKYHISGEAAAFDLPTLILIKGKSNAAELSRKDAAKDTISRIGWNRSPVSTFLLDLALSFDS